jgi:hypothetical protein
VYKNIVLIHINSHKFILLVNSYKLTLSSIDNTMFGQLINENAGNVGLIPIAPKGQSNI